MLTLTIDGIGELEIAEGSHVFVKDTITGKDSFVDWNDCKQKEHAERLINSLSEQVQQFMADTAA